jgi:P4 family phage/plasmid primase-like protien
VAKYDKDLIKTTAQGQWVPLFTSLGIPAEVLSGDALEHACPKCGGKTRFRAVEIAAGALYCSHCFASKNGDGIAAVQWWRGCSFSEAIATVADYFNIAPITGAKKSKDAKATPEEQLEFIEWSTTLAAMFARAKAGISVAALQRVGARMAKYQAGWKVIAIPIWGPKLRSAEPVGYVLYEITGKTLPTKNADGSTSQVKVKTVAGSQSGLIGDCEFPQDKTIYKTEGPSDLLTLLSLPDSTRVAVFTNSAGCKQAAPQWMVDLVADRVVRVVHDADKPGQEGAIFVGDRPGWATRLAESAREVANIQLPYPIADSSGKDLRDYILEGHTLVDIEQLPADIITREQKQQAAAFVDRAIDDPDLLAELNLKHYESQHGRKLVYWQDRWYRWKGGCYCVIGEPELRAKVWNFVRRQFEEAWKHGDKKKPVKKTSINLVSAVIAAMASKRYLPSSVEMPCWLPDRRQRNCLALNNGLLDLEAVCAGDEGNYFQPLTPDWFSTIQLSYNHDDDAKCPLWLDHLDYCLEGDAERIALLQEFVGYCLQPDCHYQRFLALEGRGSDGKSVILAGITAMAGKQNISKVLIDYFGESAYLPSMVGKMINISADSGDSIRTVAEGTLKLITDGDPIVINEKYARAFIGKINAKLICSWNMRPRITDRSDSVWRRMLLIPFFRTIPEEKKILGMSTAEWWLNQGEAPGILCWAIRGLHRLNQQRRFTIPKAMREAIADYKLESNPAAEFLQEFVVYDNDRFINATELYRVYGLWCEQSGYKPLGSRNFGKEVKTAFPLYVRKRHSMGHLRPWCYDHLAFNVGSICGESVQSHLMEGV